MNRYLFITTFLTQSIAYIVVKKISRLTLCDKITKHMPFPGAGNGISCNVFTSQLGYSKSVPQALWLVVLAMSWAVDWPFVSCRLFHIVGKSILNKLVCRFNRIRKGFFFIIRNIYIYILRVPVDIYCQLSISLFHLWNSFYADLGVLYFYFP